MPSPDRPPRRRWLRLARRVASLWLHPTADTDDLVDRSYDHASQTYDQAWTHHMRDLSLRMLDQLDLTNVNASIDLTCGTGFITAELARRTGARVTGVDRSAGMIEVASQHHHEHCHFIQRDIIDYLQALKPASVDLITCGWGLGYAQPNRAIRLIARALRPGGQVGIIDNSLFSLAGVLWCAMLTFAEQPDALNHIMRVRFLPHRRLLTTMMRLHHLRVTSSFAGSRSYHVPDGQAAIDRLLATGAAAGFEFACRADTRDDIFNRFAQLIETRRRDEQGVRVTHRYLAATGVKR